MKKIGKITKNKERDLLYQKLKTTNIKEKLSLYIQKFFNFFPQNKSTLIFSTYILRIYILDKEPEQLEIKLLFLFKDFKCSLKFSFQ